MNHPKWYFPSVYLALVVPFDHFVVSSMGPLFHPHWREQIHLYFQHGPIRHPLLSIVIKQQQQLLIILCCVLLVTPPPPSPRWFLYLVFVFLLGAICTREALRYDFLIAEKVKSRLFPSCLVGAARSTEGGDSPSWLGLSDHVCSRSRDVGNIAELLFFFFCY